MWFYFVQGLLLGGTAAAQPGPFQAYLLSQTMGKGWRRTLGAAFAPLISDGPIILLVLLLLTQTPEWFFIGLQLAGGLFLLYLARGAYKAFQRAEAVTETAVLPTERTNIFQAALMNALGPGPYIFWATIAGPILISGWHQSMGHSISFLLGFYGTLIGGFMAFIAVFAVARGLDARFTRFLSLTSAILLFLFALFQLWQGTTALMAF